MIPPRRVDEMGELASAALRTRPMCLPSSTSPPMAFPHLAYDQFAPNFISLKQAERERLTPQIPLPGSLGAVCLSGAGAQLLHPVKSSTIVQPPPTVLTSMAEEQKKIMLHGAGMMAANTNMQAGNFLQPNGLADEQTRMLLFGASMMANTMLHTALPQMKQMPEALPTIKLETRLAEPNDATTTANMAVAGPLSSPITSDAATFCDAATFVVAGPLPPAPAVVITHEMKAELAKLKDLFDSGLLPGHLYEAKLKKMLGLPSAVRAGTPYSPTCDSAPNVTNGSLPVGYARIEGYSAHQEAQAWSNHLCSGGFGTSDYVNPVNPADPANHLRSGGFGIDIDDVIDVITMCSDGSDDSHDSRCRSADTNDTHGTQGQAYRVPGPVNVFAFPTQEQEQYDDEEDKKSYKEDDNEGSLCEGKRRSPMATPRWSILREQKQLLEEFFKAVPFPSHAARIALAEQLGVSCQQVKAWFRNKRYLIRQAQRKSKS